MRCPICKKSVEDRPAAETQRNWFPFCSERCKLIDLGRWLGGKYQIPVEDTPDLPSGQGPGVERPDARDKG